MRAKLALVAVLVTGLAAASQAIADHNSVELVSIGSTGGNGAFAAAYGGASEDGSTYWFETSEKLVAGDTDTRIDVYQRSGGATTLISIGSTGGNGGFSAFFAGASADGSRVFFGTDEKLDAGDTDTRTDIYERSGGSTTQVSTGLTGGNGAFNASFDGASADGSRVFFHTSESLLVGDADLQPDVYERSGGATTQVSTSSTGGNGAFPATFAGASADGARVFFETNEALAVGETDAAQDVYVRAGGATSLVSTGTAGGNAALDAFFDGSSADGTRAFFTTDEGLVVGDTDGRYDIHERTGSVTTLISTGPSGGNGAFDSLFRGASDDGSRVFLETDETLVSGDLDSQIDVYERNGLTTTRLSTGPAGGNGAFDAEWSGASADGTHAFIETEEILTTSDSDSQVDVYERSGSATSHVSTGATGGNGAFDANFRGASASGSRVFFETDEVLAANDTDAVRDLYERAAGATTVVSAGLINGNGAFNASFADASSDGSRVLFATNEKLVNADTDSSQDLYVATAAPAFPRPGGGTPLRVPLVPAFAACSAPNATHAAPLSFGSCNPPARESSLLTTSNIGQGTAFARLDVSVGDPGTPVDEADIGISASATDVRKTSDGSDFAGKVVLSSAIRITDRANGGAQTAPATVQDTELSVPFDCVATGSTLVGSTCSLSTTADTLMPGFAKEGKRSVISAFSFELLDAGADGNVTPAGCPFVCGTGDEQAFLVQGVFTP